MKITKANNLLIDDMMEIISLESMLKDLPCYLNLKGVRLSAISVVNRKRILDLIKKIQDAKSREDGQ